MRDQKPEGNVQRDEEEIVQTNPSHMNQGNQTFIPDKQKREMQKEHSKNQEGEQSREEPRKAS